jgi:hypothetical protein
MVHALAARRALRTVVGLLMLVAAPAIAQEHGNQANWQLANTFSPQNLRSRVYTTSVNPHWLGQSDSLCYDWKDHNGSTFFLVVPTTKTKKPLFDQVKLASQLSDLSHRAHDPQNLPFTSIRFSTDRKTFTFTADSSRWEWDVRGETLKLLDRRVRRMARVGRMGAAGAVSEERRRRRPIP